MIITCEECNTSFNLDEKMIKPSGSKVRCSQCRHVFVAYPPSAAESDAAEVQPEPAAQSTDIAPAEVAPQTSEPSVEETFEESESLDFDEAPEADADQAFAEALEDLELDGSEDSQPTPPEEEELGDELDFSDLGDLSQLDLEDDAQSGLDLSEEPELELELESDDAEEKGDIDLTDIENLLELEDDEWTGQKDRQAAESKGPETAGLTTESPAASPAAGPDDAGAAADETLDLEGLDELFEVPEEAGAEDKGAKPVESGPAEQAPPDAGASPEEDGLDLSDLEELLDFEEGPDAPEPEEVELSLSENLEVEEELAVTEEDTSDEADLDLSDLEELLEMDEAEAGGEAEAEVDELDLTELEAADADADEAELLDLSDLGGTFDVDEVEDDSAPAAAETAEAPDDLELELDFESTAEADEKPLSDDFELEFETGDSQKTEDEDLAAAASAAVAAGGAVAASAAADKTEAVKAAAEAAEPAAREKAAPKKPAKPAERAEKKRSSAPALILLLLILLAVGVLALQKFLGVNIPYVTDLTKNIPYIGEFVQPQSQVSDPAGNLHLSTQNINSRFVENNTAGKLFIITGQVKNSYPTARRHILVNGKIYAQGKQLVKSENVYCGNILPDLDLKNLNFDEIKKRLDNKNGSRMTNTNVKPGTTVPFMLVFSGLPENLEEFTIEVAGSSAVQ